ncbi:E3 ubiquitin-protein ligase RNF169 [Trematomus bernacchii]|uniref:E3 ubiquitin-protein ligase RNF169 n=1 Tax=Trematomus bernacchii TaxID=40690 RepID=UPI00146EF0BC|nr:E3 ubiquitin-protein ligase RNF169 [Trematomus bernacchii]
MAAVGRNRSREARDRRRDSRRELFASPVLIPKCSDVSSGASGKHKGVLSDSENEEPLSRKIRNISAFIRKTKHSAACMGGAQRSQSCSDPLEDRAGKLKALQPPLMDRVSHSFTAGILLASENSRCSSAPPPSDRRLPWRPVLLPSSSPPIPPERSVSPDSNDSISEELNHFKPIECSPCTPPRRLADGRLVITSVVKSTPRNLNLNQNQDQSLNQNQDQSLRPSRYEVGAALMQKWRQIELDRQKMKLNGNLSGEETPSDRHGNKRSPSDRPGNKRLESPSDPPGNKRLEFDSQDAVQRKKIHIPAVKERSSGRKRAFSPVLKNSRIQTRKLDQNQKESEQRGRKSQEKTRHLDLDQEKTRHLDQEKTRHLDQDQKKTRHLDLDQEKTRHLDQDQKKTQVQDQDRVLALRLQRQFDLETSIRPEAYFLRSWRSNQNCRRRGLRRSRRISTKH